MALYNVTDYLQMFLNLLPKGKAWSRDPDSLLYKLMHAFSEEIKLIDDRMQDLISEQDPRITDELLTDHEDDLGLPDECSILSETLTIANRRDIAYSKYIAEGGLHEQVYIDIATDLGYTITIDEFTPFWCGAGGSGDPCGDQETIFYWRINIYAISTNPWVYFSSGSSGSGDFIIYVEEIGVVYCMFNKYKPAHTHLIFNYIGDDGTSPFTSGFSSGFR